MNEFTPACRNRTSDATGSMGKKLCTRGWTSIKMARAHNRDNISLCAKV